MATVIEPYTHFSKMMACGIWRAAGPKLVLVTSSYTFSAAHTSYTDVSSYEVSSGDGYTTGGIAITGNTVDSSKSDFDDVTIYTLSKVFRRGIVYWDQSSFEGVTKPLVLSILYNNAGGGTDVTVVSADFKTLWNASGVCTFTVS